MSDLKQNTAMLAFQNAREIAGGTCVCGLPHTAETDGYMLACDNPECLPHHKRIRDLPGAKMVRKLMRIYRENVQI